jgi:hypothetical protein
MYLSFPKFSAPPFPSEHISKESVQQQQQQQQQQEMYTRSSTNLPTSF